MQLQAPSQSLKIHCWVAQGFTNKICLQRYKLKNQTRNLLTISCSGFFNLRLYSMKKGVPHDLRLLEGDKERNMVSRCWNFLEIWLYPGAFSSAQRHSTSGSEIRAATWWLLREQVNLQRSPSMASDKRSFPSSGSHTNPLFPMEGDFSSPSLKYKMPQGAAANCKGTRHPEQLSRCCSLECQWDSRLLQILMEEYN